MQVQLTNSSLYLRSKLILICQLCLISILIPNAGASIPDEAEISVENSSSEVESILDITINKIYLKKHSKNSPPVGSTDVVKVSVEFSLHQIRPTTEKKSYIDVTGDLIQRWEDKRLEWNQSKIDHTSQIPLSGVPVWKPKLTLNDERVSAVSTFPYNDGDLFVNSAGILTWIQSITIRCICHLSKALVKQSAFACDLSIKPDRRMQHTIRVSLKRSYYTHSLRVLDRNWVIDRIEYYPKSTEGPELPLQYQNKRITIHMVKIHSHLYPNTLLLIVISTFLIVVSFFLPPQIGYLKLSIPIAFLLIIFVYAAMQGKFEMRIHETLIDEYCIAAMTALCLFTVLMQCFTLKLWNRNPTIKPGRFISFFYLKLPIGVGRYLCSLFHCCCKTSWRPLTARPVKFSANDQARTSQANAGEWDRGIYDVRQGRQVEPEIKYPRWLHRYGAVYKTSNACDSDCSDVIFADRWRKAARINDRYGILIVIFSVSVLTIQWLSFHQVIF